MFCSNSNIFVIIHVNLQKRGTRGCFRILPERLLHEHSHIFVRQMLSTVFIDFSPSANLSDKIGFVNCYCQFFPYDAFSHLSSSFLDNCFFKNNNNCMRFAPQIYSVSLDRSVFFGFRISSSELAFPAISFFSIQKKPDHFLHFRAKSNRTLYRFYIE